MYSVSLIASSVSDISIMSSSPKQLVKITYSSPDIQPPVYVAGAFTDPPWQPCEMKCVKPVQDPNVDPQAKPDYTFSKEFEVTGGRWQYKFRLGPGDWWVCDEAAEIGWLLILALDFVVLLTLLVIDDAGNRNNVLIVPPYHTEHPHVEKHLHARPHHRSDESIHDTAGEIVEPVVGLQDARGGSHQKHSHNNGHFNPNFSREGMEEGVKGPQPTQPPAIILPGGNSVAPRSSAAHLEASREVLVDSVPQILVTETPAKGVYEGTSLMRPNPLLSHAEAGSGSPHLFTFGSQKGQPEVVDSEAGPATFRIPATAREDTVDSDTEACPPKAERGSGVYGDRKMSSVDIEKVKILMSLKNPTHPSPSTMALQDDNILELNPDGSEYSSARISPGLEQNAHSHAPLLSHECLTCGPESSTSDVENNEPESRNQSSSSEDRDGAEDPPTPDDFDSPHLERFPTGAKEILERIATLQKEIPPDDSIFFEEDYLHRSPSFMTREAPTFPHEMPPIGSPAALRRKKSSIESPQFPSDTGRSLHLPYRNLANNTDGSSDNRSHSKSPYDSHLLPPSSVPLSYNDGNPRDSLRRSLADSGSYTSDDDELPLLGTGLETATASKVPGLAAEYAAPQFRHFQPSSLASEGARLRNTKTADLISSTEDSSSTSEIATESWWQRMLDWFSALFANLFGARRTE